MAETASRDEILTHFREQAGWCADIGSRFMAGLMARMGEDFQSGGPVAALLAGWPQSVRRDAVGLRLAGALHSGVLSGDHPGLAALYPGSDPDWSMDRIWPVARDFLAREQACIASYLHNAPQTNEVNRAILLLPGLHEIAARLGGPLHLLELGASAGLLQPLERFACEAGSWTRPGTSGVVTETDWRGPAPAFLGEPVEIASRAACDLSPVSFAESGAALRLKSYVWPDQPKRLARLSAAIDLARETGVTVEAADAAEWIEKKLAARPRSGTTVVMHAVFLHYPPPETRERILAAIEQAGRQATPEAPVAWLCFESDAFFGGIPADGRMAAQVKTWPGGAARVYARANGHVTHAEAAG